jgi:ABC-2 type transport system permease protein
MKNTRLFSLIRKEFIQIRRDPRTLYIALAIPVVQLIILGYAATNDVRNIPLAILDQDRGPAARALVDAYRAADYFALTYDIDSVEELHDLVDRGDARAGLIIPPDYSDQVRGGSQAHIAFILDGSDPSVAATALSAAQQIAQAHATQIQAERLTRSGFKGSIELPIETSLQVWYNPNLEDAYFMVPGLIGLILYAITPILTATAIVRERERGTIEQLIVTPLRPWELVLGKILPYVFIALFNTLAVLAFGSLWFGVPIRSNVGMVILLSGVFMFTSLGIGLMASSIAKTQQEATVSVWALLVPSLMLSGFFFPIEAMPTWLQVITYLIPLRYYLVIIRSLLIKGVGVVAIQYEIIALLLFGIALMTLASMRFRKRLD